MDQAKASVYMPSDESATNGGGSPYVLAHKSECSSRWWRDHCEAMLAGLLGTMTGMRHVRSRCEPLKRYRGNGRTDKVREELRVQERGSHVDDNGGWLRNKQGRLRDGRRREVVVGGRGLLRLPVIHVVARIVVRGIVDDWPSAAHAAVVTRGENRVRHVVGVWWRRELLKSSGNRLAERCQCADGDEPYGALPHLRPFAGQDECPDRPTTVESVRHAPNLDWARADPYFGVPAVR